MALASALLASAIVMLYAAPGANRPEDVIAFLNQTIVWYHQLGSQQELVDEPNDAIFLNDNRQIADQVVRLSFEYARLQAQRLSGRSEQSEQKQNAPSQYQNLLDLSNKAGQRVTQLQQEVEGLKQQITKADARRRTILQSQIDETESELQLAQARKETLLTMLQFATSATTGSSGFQATVEELARSVPAVAAESTRAVTPAASGSAPAPAVTSGDQRKSEPSSIIALLTDVMDLHRKVRLLETSLALTDSLSQSSKNLRAPVLANLRELTRRADELSDQPDSQDPAVLAQQRKEMEGLTAEFKQLSAQLLPLGKQNILLDVYRRNAVNWRADVYGHYSTAMKGLLLRLFILALVLGLVIGASEVWRRVTFRYVQDIRRRHQFLVLRRIVVWPLVIVIIVVAFANGLGSVTTFAGLLTAGMAVALQNLILSIVGYFFLIGKYGVRVGDRIQIAGVTGDVVEIGLVRLHLVEVSSGISPRQTGRAVAFSNAIVFQPDSGIFKQIPGTNFLWHEVSLVVGSGSDYHQVEQTMMEAVNKIFADYKEKMETQHRSMERAVGVVSVNSLLPESRLRLTDTGVQVTVRYPVELASAAEIDDRVTREILNATGKQPKLRTVESADAKAVGTQKA